jgi:membrane fusion protein (multidrug efflux system)
MKHIHQIAMTVLVAGAATVLQSCGSSRAEEEERKEAAAEPNAQLPGNTRSIQRRYLRA